jgi:hypothetical protein
MPPRLLRSIKMSFQVLAAIAASLICCAPGLKAADTSARLSGTFLQLTAQHKGWTEAQWSQLFDYFYQLQLSDVIVQWTAYDDTAFYTLPSAQPDSPLDKILAIADRRGLRVWVGLYFNSGYWHRIGEGPAAAANCLRNLRTRSTAIARDLTPLIKQHPAFAGWYLPEEIDDLNWGNPEARSELLRHLDLTSRALHNVAPNTKIAISTFSNARISPREFHDLWTDAFRASSVDTVLLQDGIGVHKLELNEFPLYAGALADAARSAGRDFGIVVELFRQTGGPPLDSGQFEATPADWDRVRRQLRIAHRFTSSVFGFSVPEYMTPLGVHNAGQLYADYLQERTNPQ